jgi:hypothetical protein
VDSSVPENVISSSSASTNVIIGSKYQHLLLKKLAVNGVTKIFSAFHSIRMFVTVSATASHYSLSKAK